MELVYRYTRTCTHCGSDYRTNANFSRYCADCQPLATKLRWQREKARLTPEARAERLAYFRAYYRNLPLAKLNAKRERSRRWQEARRRSRGVEPRKPGKADPTARRLRKLLAHAREEARATGEPRYVVLERIGAPSSLVDRWFLREGV